jgi:hypothetical protein
MYYVQANRRSTQEGRYCEELRWISINNCAAFIVNVMEHKEMKADMTIDPESRECPIPQNRWVLSLIITAGLTQKEIKIGTSATDGKKQKLLESPIMTVGPSERNASCVFIWSPNTCHTCVPESEISPALFKCV